MCQLTLRLPEWLEALLPADESGGATAAERMRLVIGLARANVAHGGGPFAAAVFERDSGRLVAAGVNMVLQTNCSLAHAEMVALGLAQQRLGSWDLGAPHLPAHELVSSAEPCAMCLGAAPWSGVRRLVTGARDEDARAIGFDEGEKPADWPGALARRGIVVVRDVLREDARAVLQSYVDAGGVIYNSRGG